MKKNFSGFTLIELIVTITIVMVLVGVGAMSLNNFNDVKKIESIRAEVSNHIKLARNLAITKQLPDEADETDTLNYVTVTFSNNQIVIKGIDNDTEPHTDPPYSTMKIDTNSGVGVTSSADFGFSKSTGRLTDISGVGTSVAVIVSVSRGTNVKTININDLGIISNGN